MPARTKRPAQGTTGRRASVGGGLLGALTGGSEVNPAFSQDGSGALAGALAGGNPDAAGNIIPAMINTATKAQPFQPSSGWMDYLFAGGQGHRQAEAGNQAYFMQQSGAANELTKQKIQLDFQANINKINNDASLNRQEKAQAAEQEQAKLQQQLGELSKNNIPYTPENLTQFTAGVSPSRLDAATLGADTAALAANTGRTHAAAIDTATTSNIPSLIDTASNQYKLGSAKSASDLSILPSQIAAELAKNQATSQFAIPQARAQTAREALVPVSSGDTTGNYRQQYMNIFSNQMQPAQTMNPLMSSVFGPGVGNLRLPPMQPNPGIYPSASLPSMTPANAASINANSIDKGPPQQFNDGGVIVTDPLTGKKIKYMPDGSKIPLQ